jgi:hypothetical protein
VTGDGLDHAGGQEILQAQLHQLVALLLAAQIA